MISNTFVVQDDDSTRIKMGDWYVGVYLDEEGSISVYIDHEYGEVVAMGSDIADDDDQWAEQFHISNEGAIVGSTFSKIRDSGSTHNIVNVEVTQ